MKFENRVNTLLTQTPANFSTASGTDTYAATISPAITAYNSGQSFNIKFTNSNTGACTINLNALGVKTILKNGGSALTSGDILAGQIYSISYDGTNFQIVGRLANTQMRTGSYTGDDTVSKAITGIGFRPKYVKITNRITADVTAFTMFETWDTVVDDNASGQALVHLTAGSATIVHITSISGIVSLDADGFTVGDKGTNAHPNTGGTVYNWVAWG